MRQADPNESLTLRPFENLLTTSLFTDFQIVCKDRELPVHRAILHTYSPVFATMLQNQMYEVNSNKVIVDDIEGSVMAKMLLFIYAGKVELRREVDKKLLYAADKYEVNDLKKILVDSMCLNLNMKNVFEILDLAGRYDEDKLLRNCITLIRL